MRLRFALDENFPTPIVEALNRFNVEATLVPVGQIDGRLRGLEDWELLLALHHHRDEWVGLITTDSGILNQTKSLQVLAETRLALVVPIATGHDPLRATGMLLSSLPDVCSRLRETRGGVFRLRSPRSVPENPREVFAKLARHRNQSATELRQSEGLSPEELTRNPLDQSR